MLAALRSNGALSRSELAQRVGLSRTTLSEITASLLLRGAIIVANTDAATRAGSGRPAERLALDPASGQFLGVDFGHRRVHVVVADASHEVIASGLERYPDDASWEERLAISFELIERLSRETGVHYGALQAVGIGVPGPYTGVRGGSNNVTWKKQLAPDGVDAAFADRFGAPVFVDNNTRLAALAEAITQRDAAVDNLIYLRLSDGVGGGLVVSGRLVSGSRGFAGELGHVTADPAGAQCRCGKRGCLETIASVPAILRACREAGAAVETLDDLAVAVTMGDPVVDVVLREIGATIGRVLGAAAMTLNPREVVIGGEIVRIAPVLVEQAAATMRYELYSISSDQPLIVRAAQLHDSDGALGAIAAIFHQSPLLAGYPEPAASGAPVQQHQQQRSAL
ncbi:MAG TPA: ROK family transcriptional regulator [Agromyces sp.]|nr:ROK family transcriptional regulator [Agromyces sp.]